MRKVIAKTQDDITPENLVQLIAESEITEAPEKFTNEENSLFVKRAKLCYLLNDIEFTIESYGLANFFIEYSDQLPELHELGDLLSEFGFEDTETAIRLALSFYNDQIDKFQYLLNDPDDYFEKLEELEAGFKGLSPEGNFFIPLNKTIVELAEMVKKNPEDFYVFTNS